jgi:hypothetical protein
MNRTPGIAPSLAGKMVGVLALLLVRTMVEATASLPPADLVLVPVRRKTS